MSTRVCWIGHATLLIESDNQRILIDPFLKGNPTATRKVEDVEADFILVSHGHQDHVADAVAVARRTGATCIANFEITNWLQKQGVAPEKSHAMHIGGSYAFPFGRLKLTLAIHGSMLPDGSNGGMPCGLLLTLNDGTVIYDAADTGLFSDMKLIGEAGLDLAILPIGDNFTMGPEDAVRAVEFLQPKKVLPIHYNTWPLIEQDADQWAAQVREKTQAEPVVLQPGEWLDL